MLFYLLGKTNDYPHWAYSNAPAFVTLKNCRQGSMSPLHRSTRFSNQGTGKELCGYGSWEVERALLAGETKWAKAQLVTSTKSIWVDMVS